MTRRRLRRRQPRRRRRHLAVLLVALVAVLLVPVPWMHVITEDPPGTAWRLNGRLEVDGTVIDPPGRWTWLAVGRPQLLGEVLLEQFTGAPNPQVDDLRTGPVGARPALNEPAAAAIGLHHAGHDIALGILVEVRRPLLDGYPDRGLLAAVNGVALTDPDAWERVSAWALPDGATAGADSTPEALTFQLRGGPQLHAPGPGLPYQEIHVVPTAPAGLEAGISFELARRLPVDWFRNLSLGRSHGLMVALMTYVHGSGRDLAQGRHIAGTGGILGDGTVTPIGGLPAKARAAHRAGADVLFVPHGQTHELTEVHLDGTEVVPVATLTDAIAWLAQPVA